MRYLIIPVTSFQQNSTVLWCEHTNMAALIDPGGQAQRLIDVIREHKLVLEKILLTHGHLDHVGAAASLATHFQVPIFGPHLADAFLLNSLPLQCQLFGIDRSIPALKPTYWLQDHEELTVGNLHIEVLHCPGHTPGHVVFFCASYSTVWVGDVLFRGSIGRTDLPGGDSATLYNSIAKKLWPLGDEVTFIPGHGATSTIGHERLFNPFAKKIATIHNVNEKTK